MFKKMLLLAIALSVCNWAYADRELDRDEVVDIFKILTQTPQKTWVPQGTITAEHFEFTYPKTTDEQIIQSKTNEELQTYNDKTNKLELTEELQQMRIEAIPYNVRHKLSNTSSMDSDVVIHYDGHNFLWQIDVKSRQDSVKPGAELAGNYYTENFKLSANQKRIFAWDGEKYTTYFLPTNHAMIIDSPSGVNGSLTAGCVPWGLGQYSYDNLLKKDFSATEIDLGDTVEIHLTIINNGREEFFKLDPSRNYALIEYIVTTSNYKTYHSYDNYQSVENKWLPYQIVIEKYDITQTPEKLLARDIWSITSISAETPDENSFSIDFEYDAFIEDYRFGAEPLQYNYNSPHQPTAKSVDIDNLIQEHMRLASSDMEEQIDCGKIAFKYIANKLGYNVRLEDAAGLDSEDSLGTSMDSIANGFNGLDLKTVAAQTDINALKQLSGCEVILYLPQEKHFVVLGNVSDDSVSLIDISRDRIYYTQTFDELKTQWQGAALLISKSDLAFGNKLIAPLKEDLSKIVGAGDCQQCNTTIQQAGDYPCSEVGGDCSTHVIKYTRKGCGSAPSGTCPTSSMPGGKSEPCILDENLECVGTGEWTSYNINACG